MRLSAGLFTLEAAAKLFAFGPAMYWLDGWNRFDLFVVIASDVGILLTAVGGLSVGAVGTLARVLRLGRVVRLARSMKSLRQMVRLDVGHRKNAIGQCISACHSPSALRLSLAPTYHSRVQISTLILTIPQMLNVGALLLLLIFIYAIAGVQLFAQVGWDGQYLVAQANFQNVGYAMLTLYRWMTGENWNMMMYSLAGCVRVCSGLLAGGILSSVYVSWYIITFNTHCCCCCLRSCMSSATYASVNSYPCDPNPPWDERYPTGCGSSIAYAYGYSYTVLVTFIVLQLLVAVVLEAFSDAAEDDAEGKLDSDALQRFTDTWVKFDKDCTMFISTAQLPDFMRALPPPMGVGGLAVVSKEEVNQLISKCKSEQTAVCLSRTAAYVYSFHFSLVF
jgi:hypothetical protein